MFVFGFVVVYDWRLVLFELWIVWFFCGGVGLGCRMGYEFCF